MWSSKCPQVVLVQSIVVVWSKAARGGKNAALRNRVPEAVRLPAQLPGADHLSSGQLIPILYHALSYPYAQPSEFERPFYDNWESLPSHLPDLTTITLQGGLYGYKRQSKYVEQPPPPRNTLRVDQTLYVTFDWKGIIWAPVRPSKVDRFEFKLGQWGQIRLNGRTGFLEGGEWEYYKYVLNIGYAPGLASGFFVDRPPTVRISDMADLW
jgi:hypothetical protein